MRLTSVITPHSYHKLRTVWSPLDSPAQPGAQPPVAIFHWRDHDQQFTN